MKPNGPCKHRVGGKCELGRYGGTPSVAVCVNTDIPCPSYDGPARTKELIAKYVNLTIRQTATKTAKRIKRLYHGWIIPWMERKSTRCCGQEYTNGNSPIFWWTLFSWYGWPKPLRRKDKQYHGCGCLCFLRDAWDELVDVWQREWRVAL